jgi:hypothetical protein
LKGKPWTIEEEKQLREMVQARKPVTAMARFFGKSPESIKKKMGRLGLKVVVRQISQTTTTDDLPSIEEALKTLNEALTSLKIPGLDQSETLRLRSIIQGVKIYKELFADYVNYRALEEKVEELIRELERDGEKASGVARKTSSN